MDTKEKSLLNALSHCGLRELPPVDDEQLVWIKAVALLVKRDCSQSYAYVQKGEKGTIRIVNDFGNNSPIYKIESIHPYAFLSDAFLPSFKKNTKEERINWLERYDVYVDKETTLKDLDKMVLDQAIKNNLKSLINE